MDLHLKSSELDNMMGLSTPMTDTFQSFNPMGWFLKLFNFIFVKPMFPSCGIPQEVNENLNHNLKTRIRQGYKIAWLLNNKHIQRTNTKCKQGNWSSENQLSDHTMAFTFSPERIWKKLCKQITWSAFHTTYFSETETRNDWKQPNCFWSIIQNYF